MVAPALLPELAPAAASASGMQAGEAHRPHAGQLLAGQAARAHREDVRAPGAFEASDLVSGTSPLKSVPRRGSPSHGKQL